MGEQELGKAVLKLTTDATGLEEGLDKAEKKTSFAMKAMVATASAALVKLGKDCFDSFVESERAVAKFTGAIRASGNQSKIAVSAITTLAESLQRTTTFSDEATLSAAAMLHQLSGLTERGLREAIPAVQDFASAMGMDLESAAQLVGKAIAGNVGALSRYGIEVKEGATKTETFDNVIASLEGHFKGMSEQIGKTTGGQLVIFRNEVDNLKESLGALLAKGLNPFISSINRTLGVNELLKVDPSTISSVGQLKDGIAALRDRFKELKETTSGHGTGRVGYGELAAIQNKIDGLTRRLAELGRATEEAEKIAVTAAERAAKALARREWDDHIARLELTERDTDDLTQANDRLAASLTPSGSGALIAAAEAASQLTAETRELTDANDQLARSSFDVTLFEATKAAAALAGNIQGLEDRFTSLLPKVQDTGSALKAAIDQANRTLSAISSVYDSLEGIAAQYELNRETALENEYQARKKAIEATITDEKAKEDALAALDEEFEGKRSEQQRKAAIADKALAILGATISAIEGTVRALATPPVPNIALASIMGALGAVQIAAIAAQPIPEFAAGGDFVVPPGYPNDSFPMRVQSGEHVSVTPAGQGQSETIQNVIYVDGQRLWDLITRGTRNKKILISNRAIVT